MHIYIVTFCLDDSFKKLLDSRKRANWRRLINYVFNFEENKLRKCNKS